MEVYAPLAHRLGLKLVKEELEDTALRFLDPDAYAEIESQLKLRRDERDKFLAMMRQRLSDRLTAEHMNFHLESRVKSIYGIYRKVYMQGRDFDEIFDVYALRVIVDTVIECYNVLGIVHDLFRPIPNRFKDYISMPRPICTSRCTPPYWTRRGSPSRSRSAPGICTMWRNTA